MTETGPIQIGPIRPPVVLVAIHEWNRLSNKALRLAMELSPDVFAVHLITLKGPNAIETERQLRRRWEDEVVAPSLAAHHPHPPALVVLVAPYRRIHVPFLRLTRKLEDDNPDRTIAVLIPELVPAHWWERLLHSRRAEQLRSALLAYGGSRVVAIVVPWHLREPSIEEAMTEEERSEPVRGHSTAGLPRRDTGK